MKTLKKIKLDMWINAIMTVLLGVLFMEELNQARKEIDKTEGKKPMRQNMFKVV